MRQIVSAVDFDKKGLLQIKGNDFVHIRKVLHACVGDMVQVLFSCDNLQQSVLPPIVYQSTICKVDEKKGFLVLQKCSPPQDTQQKNSFDLWLLQAIAKPAIMQQILNQAVQIGAKNFFPVKSQYSQAPYIKALQTKKERFLAIIKQATEQSGNTNATKLFDVGGLETAIKTFVQDTKGKRTIKIALFEDSAFCTPLEQVLKTSKLPIQSCALFVGPEGGISAGEVQILKDNGFFLVHLQTNILRCETAALYGSAILQYQIQEANKKWTCKE